MTRATSHLSSWLEVVNGRLIVLRVDLSVTARASDRSVTPLDTIHPLSEILIPAAATLRDALAAIQAGELKITVIVDDGHKLLGIVTDADTRQAILDGIGLDEPVTRVMNTDPLVARVGIDRRQMFAMMRRARVMLLPVVDDSGKVVRIETFFEAFHPGERSNTVVLMAGGRGRRLAPLTQARPKPMLQVGTKPILETILDSFSEFGFRDFRIAVNYKADLLEAYFGDGSKWDVKISYLREERSLGTAGALALLEERPTEPLIVMNADILTKVNFVDLLKFHNNESVAATMCLREHNVVIPYGVVATEGARVTSIEEKPSHHTTIAAGIYVLEPRVLDRIPPDTNWDMPELLRSLLDAGEKIAGFPVTDYWLDIGHMDDFVRANGEFESIFT